MRLGNRTYRFGYQLVLSYEGLTRGRGLLPRYLVLYHRSTGLGRAGHGTGVCRGRTPALTRVSMKHNRLQKECQAVF